MSDEIKKERTVADIQTEYQNLCVKAGHIQYQVFALETDLKMVNETLKALNIEAATLQSKTQEVPVNA